MINQTAQHSAGPLGLPTPGEVHVWTANCDISAERLADMGTTLTADEGRRASQFRFEKHRSRYIVRRGVLRTILGAYLNMDPSEIRFVTNAYGKPALQKTIESGPNMHFNLSHSESMIAIGVAVGRRVGIDIEQT